MQVKIPQSKLEERLLGLNKQQFRRDIWVMGVSENTQQNTKDLLYYDRQEFTDINHISQPHAGLVTILVEISNRLDNHTRKSFLRDVNRASVEAGLLFVSSHDRLQVFYALKSGQDKDKPIILSIPGPNMEQLLVRPLDKREATGKQKHADFNTNSSDEHDTGERENRNVYNRLAGAIGLGDIERGFELLDRASRLVVVVIGTGRAGSWLAFRLAQSGVGHSGALVLVDPDTIGPENLDGMIVAHKAIGFPKVFGVGGTIAGITGSTSQPICINASLSDPEVLDVLRMADIVFTNVDEPAVRLAAAVVAARHHIVHIDVTGGEAWTAQKRAVVGGELRMFVPGSHGCLACQDRYDWRQALQLLGLSGEAERKRRRGLNWHEQRPGSSVDILLPVIGEALQSFWGIVRGEVKESFWWHYEKDHRGRPVWTQWSDRDVFGRWRKCSICDKQAGLGDIIE